MRKIEDWLSPFARRQRTFALLDDAQSIWKRAGSDLHNDYSGHRFP
jgi:hypothetical protein